MKFWTLFKKIKKPAKTYEVKISPMQSYKTIKCLKCKRTSYNENDIEQLYCGYCHKFHKK